MHPCTLEDFESLGIRDLKRDKEQFFHRLCPNMKKDDQLYKVQNSYHDHKIRNSFQVEITQCDRINKPDFCNHDDKDIDRLLD